MSESTVLLTVSNVHAVVFLDYSLDLLYWNKRDLVGCKCSLRKGHTGPFRKGKCLCKPTKLVKPSLKHSSPHIIRNRFFQDIQLYQVKLIVVKCFLAFGRVFCVIMYTLSLQRVSNVVAFQHVPMFWLLLWKRQMTLRWSRPFGSSVGPGMWTEASGSTVLRLEVNRLSATGSWSFHRSLRTLS